MSVNKEILPHLIHSAKPKIAIFRDAGIPTYVNDPSFGYGLDNFFDTKREATYLEETFYLNYTNQTITFIKRDGIPVVIDPQPHREKRGVVIVRCFTFSGKALKEATADLGDVTRIFTHEREALMFAIKAHEDNGYVTAVRFYLEYYIPTEDIHRFGDSVYHFQTDTVITSKSRKNAPVHPYSADFHNVGVFGNMYDYANQKALNFRIRVFDHSPNASAKFIRLAGKVFKLEPERDNAFHVAEIKDKKGNKRKIMRDYVEVIYPCKHDTETHKVSGIECRRYTFDEAKEYLGITDTYLLAQDTEHEARVHTHALMESKREFEIMQHNHEKTKFKWSLESDNNKQEIIKTTHQLELLKQLQTKESLEAKRLQGEAEVIRQKLADDRAEIERIQAHRQKLQERSYQMSQDTLKHLELRAKHEIDTSKMQMQHQLDTSRWIMGSITTVLGLVALYYKAKASK